MIFTLLISITVSLMPEGPVQRVTNLSRELKDNPRLELFEAGVKVWLKSPIIGAGVGGFTESTESVYPHNLWLEILADLGLVGAAIAAFFFLFVLIEVVYTGMLTNPLVFAYLVFTGYSLTRAQLSGSFYRTADFWWFGLATCSIAIAHHRTRRSRIAPVEFASSGGVEITSTKPIVLRLNGEQKDRQG
jgi:O-antigen ligase